jgi:AcrR family transcriptional regulator
MPDLGKHTLHRRKVRNLASVAILLGMLSAVNVTVEQQSRRERKKHATREAIHDAALDLVEDRGLAGVTVEDITERADVAPRTFFNYFSSKEDAVIGREPGYADQLVTALRERPADEPVTDSLRHVITESFVARAVDPAAFLRRIRVVKSEPLLLSRMAAQFEQVEQNLTDEVALRTATDPGVDLEPSLLVAVFLTASRTALMHWCDRAGSKPVAQVMDDAFDRLLTGLRPPTLSPSDPSTTTLKGQLR